MAVERIVTIEPGFHPEVRKYHSAKEIWKCASSTFRKPLDECHEEEFQWGGLAGSNIVKCIFQVPGVVFIIIRPYELQITKTAAFRWEEIDPEIKRIIEEEGEWIDRDEQWDDVLRELVVQIDRNDS